MCLKKQTEQVILLGDCLEVHLEIIANVSSVVQVNRVAYMAWAHPRL